MKSYYIGALILLGTYSLQIYRESKFIGFGVGIVRFQNSVCNSSSNLQGTCYSRRQCQSVDGEASGRCAQNIGVCCVIHRTCSGTSSYNNTYFTNTNFPNSVTTGTRCVMTIVKCNDNICQVRIDFLGFSLSQPNATGVCATDALTVTGGAGPVPIICGENTGQHIYVDFNGNETIQMIVTTAALQSLSRNWNLKVTQIACDCPTRAPIGCLMHYTALTGTVNSFNYGTSGNVIDPATGVSGTRELVNENYGVCIAMAPGYCAIEWSQASNGSFMLSGNAMAGIGVVTGTDCTSDFVVIPDPFYPNGTMVGTDRFCGLQFPTVVSYSKPFVLTVVTNGDEVNDTQNKGFSLNYRQLPCPTNALNNVYG